jgi:hypothetical protein
MKKGNIEGTIIDAKKIWWLKINKKQLRMTPADGATFPYLLKVKYTLNNLDYEKKKMVYCGNENINVGEKVIVTYDEEKLSKVLSLNKK